MALQFILKENVLTDNILYVASEGKLFKGGYVSIVKEYTYQNPWSDSVQVKRFRSKDSLFKYLVKNYEDLDFDFSGTCLID